MDMLRKIINNKMQGKKRYRNKHLTLAMALGTVAGVITGIAVYSKSDKINKVIRRIKSRSTESMKNGKCKVEDLLEEAIFGLECFKENLAEEFNDMKDKSEYAKEVLYDKMDRNKDKVKDIAEETMKEVKEDLTEEFNDIKDKSEDVKEMLYDEMDKNKDKVKNIAEETIKEVKEELNKD